MKSEKMVIIENSGLGYLKFLRSFVKSLHKERKYTVPDVLTFMILYSDIKLAL